MALEGKTNEKITAIVKITPRAEYPFKVTDTSSRYGEHIKFEISEVKSGKLKKLLYYVLKIENTRTYPGGYNDFIYLETDSKIKPEIRISVNGKIVEQ